jgi:hypothetical protein
MAERFISAGTAPDPGPFRAREGTGAGVRCVRDNHHGPFHRLTRRDGMTINFIPNDPLMSSLAMRTE